jgi:hypothetical protein
MTCEGAHRDREMTMEIEPGAGASPPPPSPQRDAVQGARGDGIGVTNREH